MPRPIETKPNRGTKKISLSLHQSNELHDALGNVPASSSLSTTTTTTTMITSKGAHIANGDDRTRLGLAMEPNQDAITPMRCLVNALTRKKPLDGRMETSLNRCLGLLDLTTIGVGSTLGLGLYVLAGQVASNKAGPAVVVSFALAALASAFSALCYAEFAGRVPRAGSAYAYSYITSGEFVAFIIGWNLVLEYVIGASSVARGFSGYLRFVCEHLFNRLSSITAPLNSDKHSNGTNGGNASLFDKTPNEQRALDVAIIVSPSMVNMSSNIATPTLLESITDYVYLYFDWISIAIVLIVTIFILFGVKESTKLTLAFTAINITVVIVVTVSSFSLLDLHNWQLRKEELPSPSCGEGGFIPFGWSGILSGSATCFFGFIGFDSIASSAEEAKNPKRNVPLSIVLSLFISFLAYMAIAIVQTLIWPYYAQDKITILPYIFDQMNMPFTYWIVLLGGVAGLASSQLGGMYPLPRILYSMAQDKLIYGNLAHVNRRLKLPVRATIVGSIFIALLACLLDIEDLADMVSIGTLAAYSLVSLSVLIIRYENRSDAVCDNSSFNDEGHKTMQLFDKDSWISTDDRKNKLATVEMKLDDCIGPKKWSLPVSAACRPAKPTEATSSKSKLYIIAIVALTILLNLIVSSLTSWSGKDELFSQESHRFSLRSFLAYSVVLLTIFLIIAMYLLSKLPIDRDDGEKEMFMVPLVPLTPTLSILVNTFLMLNLSPITWIRFTVWMAIGFFIYFSYGIWHSEGYFMHMSDEGTMVNGDDRQRMS